MSRRSRTSCASAPPAWSKMIVRSPFGFNRSSALASLRRRTAWLTGSSRPVPSFSTDVLPWGNLHGAVILLLRTIGRPILDGPLGGSQDRKKRRQAGKLKQEVGGTDGFDPSAAADPRRCRYCCYGCALPLSCRCVGADA